MKEITEIESYAHENHVPILMKDGLEFMLKLITERNCRSILEVGTAIGYSAICMARLNDQIQIDTLEIDPERYAQAVENIKENHLDSQIHVYLIDAMEFIPAESYDFIFIDAAKSQYRRYMEHFLPYLNRNGVFLFDNLNFHGFVDDPSLTHNRSTRQMCAKIKRFREWILTCEECETKFHPEIGDGIAVVGIKKKQNMIK